MHGSLSKKIRLVLAVPAKELSNYTSGKFIRVRQVSCYSGRAGTLEDSQDVENSR